MLFIGFEAIVGAVIAVASIAHTVASWWGGKASKQSATASRAAKVAEVARAVYDAAEATSKLKGTKGAAKWAVAKDLIPKAAKAVGLPVTAALIADVEALVQLIAMQRK